jgi:hypothetical protein
MKSSSASVTLSAVNYVKLKIPREIHRKIRIRAVELGCSVEQFYREAAVEAVSKPHKAER